MRGDADHKVKVCNVDWYERGWKSSSFSLSQTVKIIRNSGGRGTSLEGKMRKRARHGILALNARQRKAAY